MARSCLFICRSSLVVILKQNVNFQISKSYAYAYIHKCVSLRQHKETMKETDHEDYGKGDPESLKIKIMKAGLTFVPEYGWNEKSLALGAQSIGLSSAAHTIVKGGGPDLVHFFNVTCNMKLENYLTEVSSTSKKLDLQEFITGALENRIKMIIPYLPKWPEAMALMARPTQFPVHSQNMLQLMDSIWHFYGDKSIDVTWYSKRLFLALAYKATELCLLEDKSPDFSDTFDFLQRRVENVVKAENVIHMINENGKHSLEFGKGALITARNLLGLRLFFS